MSKSRKSEKRGKYRNPRRIRCADVENEQQSWAISQRHQYGGTEKILRRNRKLWTRLLAKRRRANGKAVISKQLADRTVELALCQLFCIYGSYENKRNYLPITLSVKVKIIVLCNTLLSPKSRTRSSMNSLPSGVRLVQNFSNTLS